MSASAYRYQPAPDSASARISTRQTWPTSRTRAAIYSRIGTTTLNGIDPEATRRVALTRITGHSMNRIEERAPWRVADRLRANT